jgi:ubiquinone/menaquinone biosynthesis C-methylase UbiE
MRNSSVDWEYDIYANGLQVNKYPFDSVVSLFNRRFARNIRSKIKVLEIGCGTGNNIAFLQEAGFCANGIDSSKTAIALGNQFLVDRDLEPCLSVGNPEDMPEFLDEMFDVVLDRGCLTQNSYASISQILEEALRVLKPSGSLFSFTLFGRNHPDFAHGVEVSRNTFDHFSQGYFKTVGLTSSFDEDSIKDLFSKFELELISRQCTFISETILTDETYTVIAKKGESR